MPVGKAYPENPRSLELGSVKRQHDLETKRGVEAMTKAAIDRHTGLAFPPIHPCYKAPDRGLCRVRIDGDSEFACGEESPNCKHLAKKGGKTE